MKEDTPSSKNPLKRFFSSKTRTLSVTALLIAVAFLGFWYSGGIEKEKAPAVPVPTPVYSPVIPEQRVPGQIIVKFRDDVPESVIQEKLKQYDASIKEKISGINTTIITVPEGQEDAILKELSKDPIVKYAEPDYIQSVQFIPNDTFFRNQWGLVNTGQVIEGRAGTPNADINVKFAWDTTRGNGIKVAVIDTGIDTAHPDLAGKVVASRIFTTTQINDRYGHGTHVAGIIAAESHNSQGVSGVCPGCQLLVAKALDDSGRGMTSIIAQAIIWAADNGAQVINLSEGGPTRSQSQQDALDYAWSKGVVLVAAAGNSNSSTVFYPAASANVLSVGATDNRDRKASFSNFGLWVSVTAPGDSIYSTLPVSPYAMQATYASALSYDYISGTSMATPIVAGVAALVWTTPHGTSNASVVQRIIATVDSIPGTGQSWRYGRVNAGRAVGAQPTFTPQPTNAAPTVFVPSPVCAGSVNNICPTPTPTATPITPTFTPMPTVNVVATQQPTIQPTLVPTIDPCVIVVSVQGDDDDDDDDEKHEKKSKGGVHRLTESFLDFLIKLLNIILQLFGGTIITPTPGVPTPTSAPTPIVQPTVAPGPTQGPGVPTPNPC